jgi:multisubunit Na+/H+ antiporter MnhB subunit
LASTGYVGEADFRPTPGGTWYFVFSKVSANSKAASRFVVTVCFLGSLGVGLACLILTVMFFGFVWDTTKTLFREVMVKRAIQVQNQVLVHHPERGR